MSSPLMILTAGPSRSGTGEDRALPLAEARGIAVRPSVADVPAA